ncbi:MAG: hypothetical protein WDN44_10260, partial [Sphingomonas sp.]
MGSWIVTLENAAMAVSNTAAAAPLPDKAQSSLSQWILIGLVALGVVAGLGIWSAITTFRDRFPKPKKHEDHDFTRMLCDQVWRHTDYMTSVFAQRMRQEPSDLTTLHVLLRNLREDLAAPIHFIDQVQCQPPTKWPNYNLLGAFTNWAGQLKSMASQLADHQTTLIYPPGKDAADKYRDQMLVYKYLTERTILSRGVAQLRSNAFAFCDVAKKTLDDAKKKHSFGFPSGDDDKDEHPECPCCKHRHEHIQIQPPDPLDLPPLPTPPKPPAPPPPPPPAAMCFCAAPRLCVCARCTCSCTCTPAPAAAPAKAG